MGKLILGIGVVILLQISFSIYMAIGERVDTSTATAPKTEPRFNSDQKGDAPLDNERLSEGAPSADRVPPHEPSGPRVEEPTRPWLRPGIRRHRFDKLDNGQAYRIAVKRRLAGRRNETLARVEPLVRRELFGGMMVETRYEAPANRVRGIPRQKSRREVFGRMIMEYKFAV